MKNSLEGFTYRFKQAKRVSELEYRAVGNFKFEEQEKKGLKKSKQSLKYLYEISKRINIHIMRVPEGQETEKGQRGYLK